MKIFAVASLLALCIASAAKADTLDLTGPAFHRVASYSSSGEYNLVGLGTWNGQPVSPTNQPTPYQALLAQQDNFYLGSGSFSNTLFIQVTNVITTQDSYWNGLAFLNVSQTGLRVSLPSALSAPSFDFSYSNPNQALVGPNGAGFTPESTTAGFSGYVLNNDTYWLTTDPSGQYAFASFPIVTGTQRTYNGGIFALTFAGTDLNAINWQNATVQATYGYNNQSIAATYAGDAASPVPEPPTIIAVASGMFLLLGGMMLHREQDSFAL